AVVSPLAEDGAVVVVERCLPDGDPVRQRERPGAVLAMEAETQVAGPYRLLQLDRRLPGIEIPFTHRLEGPERRAVGAGDRDPLHVGAGAHLRQLVEAHRREARSAGVMKAEHDGGRG